MSELLKDEIVAAGLVVTVIDMKIWRSSSMAVREGTFVDAGPEKVASTILDIDGGSGMASEEPLPIIFPLGAGDLHYPFSLQGEFGTILNTRRTVCMVQTGTRAKTKL